MSIDHNTADRAVSIRRWINRVLLLAIGVVCGVLLAATVGLAGRVVGVLPWSHVNELAVVASENDLYEVVVYRDSSGVIDPVWRIAVRQRGELFPDEWTVGCINGDDPDNSFRSVRWEHRTTLVVETAHDLVRVSVDPKTGEPASSDSGVWNWDC